MDASFLYCPICGALNAATAQTCLACGKPLSEAPPEALQPLARMPSGQLPPQHLLQGRFRMLKRIGAGGFAAVYQGEDTQAGNRRVAIKEMSHVGLPPHDLQEATEAFHREAQLLRELEHPSLPRIYGHFSEGGHWYLVMAFIQGETLEEYLARQGGRLPLQEVFALGIQLCEVLHYLHTRQPPVIFRDLKPANVMLTPNRRVYLIDFGIARHFTPGKQHDTVAFGSPGYAAPEQYGKAQTTPRSDLFSLGALLHHLLTGTDPSEQPMHFAPITGPAPAGLAWLIAQMVDLDANQRPASMAVVKAALERLRDAWQREQAQARTASSAPPAYHPVTVHRSTVSPPAVPPALPASVRPVGMSGGAPAGRTWSLRVVYLVGMAGVLVCSLLVALLRSPSQGNQTAGPDYLATVYVGQTATQSALPPERGVTYALAWSPDGTRIASGGYDGDVRIWDAQTGTILLGHPEQSAIHSLAWSPDGRKIASTGLADLVEVWDAATGQSMKLYDTGSPSPRALAWSPDSARMASSGANGTVQVWNATTGQTLLTYQGQNVVVDSVAWSPDGTRLASGGSNGLVEVWDATNGSPLYTDRRHSGVVEQVAWSPDGTRLASASDDHTVQVWDATTGANPLVYTGHRDQVLALAWSPDGQALASAGQDTTVQVWKASDGTLLFAYRGHTQTIYTIAWSPVCKGVASTQPCLIASGGEDDVQVWDALTGRHVVTYPGN